MGLNHAVSPTGLDGDVLGAGPPPRFFRPVPAQLSGPLPPPRRARPAPVAIIPGMVRRLKPPTATRRLRGPAPARGLGAQRQPPTPATRLSGPAPQGPHCAPVAPRPPPPASERALSGGSWLQAGKAFRQRLRWHAGSARCPPCCGSSQRVSRPAATACSTTALPPAAEAAAAAAAPPQQQPYPSGNRAAPRLAR
jgi:hypothetical protein